MAYMPTSTVASAPPSFLPPCFSLLVPVPRLDSYRRVSLPRVPPPSSPNWVRSGISYADIVRIDRPLPPRSPLVSPSACSSSSPASALSIASLRRHRKCFCCLSGGHFARSCCAPPGVICVASLDTYVQGVQLYYVSLPQLCLFLLPPPHLLCLALFPFFLLLWLPPSMWTRFLPLPHLVLHATPLLLHLPSANCHSLLPISSAITECVRYLSRHCVIVTVRGQMQPTLDVASLYTK